MFYCLLSIFDYKTKPIVNQLPNIAIAPPRFMPAQCKYPYTRISYAQSVSVLHSLLDSLRTRVLVENSAKVTKMPHKGGNKQKQKVAVNGAAYCDQRETENRDQTEDFISCCLPSGCQINTSVNLSRAVRVICNSDSCNQSGYMHTECFEAFEDSILAHLRGTGRARSWSEKQRRQNIWTKKGYDLAYKCCACLCDKGHLRKDLDFVPALQEEEQTQNKAKRKKKKTNDKPVIGCATSTRPRLSSQSSNCSETCSNSSPTEQRSPISPAPKTPTKKTRSISATSTLSDYFFPDITNGNSACSAEAHELNTSSNFLRRSDFSSFLNVLPRHKVNPYHIKMEEESSCDEARQFVLSTLSARYISTVSCVLCQSQLPVFDKYPLVDGTFFLSPRKLSTSCIDVSQNAKTIYLSAVCMSCLEGVPYPITCRLCKKKWNGSTHQLGTMYSYDIFAASPCCQQRVACQACRKPVVDLGEGKNYFSEFSQPMRCPHCGVSAYHCIKPMSSFETNGRIAF